jgi:hypothetical protein
MSPPPLHFLCAAGADPELVEPVGLLQAGLGHMAHDRGMAQAAATQACSQVRVSIEMDDPEVGPERSRGAYQGE